MLDGLTKEEWLKFNYDLQVGDPVYVHEAATLVKNIKEVDNIDHLSTKYPVVVGVDYEESIFPEKIWWYTIEELFLF